METPIRSPHPNSLPVPPVLRRAAVYLLAPQRLGELDEGEFERQVTELDSQGVLAAALLLYKTRTEWLNLPEQRRQTLTRWEARYKASAAAFWSELVTVLDLLSNANLPSPCLLKGAHAAQAFYASPHVRTMSDVDLLFEDLAAAERAQVLLLMNGYRETAVCLVRDPWALNHHLTALQNPHTRFILEIHGSVLYPPRDRRAIHLAPLFQGMERLEIEGRSVRVLSPEAFIVVALAHALDQHRAETPRLQALLDVAQVLQTRGSLFHWKGLRELAEATGLTAVVATGLLWAAELLEISIPESETGWIRSSEPQCDEAQIGTPESSWKDRSVLHAIANAPTTGSALAIVAQVAFPPRAYVRARFPEKSHWPLGVLYLYRWGKQLAKLAAILSRAVCERLCPKHDDKAVSGDSGTRGAGENR